MRQTVMIPCLVSVLALGIAAAAATSAVSKDAAVPAYVSGALSDKSRTKADTDQDALRKPGEMLVYAGIKPGSVVAEYIPGAGYFTKIFGKAVGPNGHLYTLAQAMTPALTAIQNDPTYGGKVTILAGDLTTIKPPVPVDVVWTSRNYHDLSKDVRNKLNQVAFSELKPGGIYIVLDHAAVPGSGDYAMAQRPALHRIDENLVKLEVLQAGFKLTSENHTLRNPMDNHLTAVFDKSVRCDTDQFILKFTKPK